jgi:integrase
MARRPKYRRHTIRDLGFVEYQGKRRYFPGPYKSAESLKAYREFLLRHVLVEFATAKSDTLTMRELVERYQAWAERTYPIGPRSEYANLRAATQLAISDQPAEEFAPSDLKAIMGRMAVAKRSRGYVNAVAARIKRMFRWAVHESLVPPAVLHALQALPGLRRGRSAAVESAQRLPVEWDAVEAVLPQLSPTVAAMVLLHWHTGVRSQSICHAKREQFDTSCQPWEWRPIHKTQATHSLVVFVGPQAQRVLAPFLANEPYLFQPKHLNGKRAKGYRAFYDSVSYLRAVSRACDRAGIPRWTPHMLRHAKATRVRAAYGLEAAQATTGHATLAAAQIYAQRRNDLARQVAAESG